MQSLYILLLLTILLWDKRNAYLIYAKWINHMHAPRDTVCHTEAEEMWTSNALYSIKFNNISMQFISDGPIKKKNQHWFKERLGADHGTSRDLNQWCFSLSTHMGAIQPQCVMHWGRVTHLCISKITSIASDNGLVPSRRQAIIWSNAGILLILWNLKRNSYIFIQGNAFENVVWKKAAILSRPQCVNTSPPRTKSLIGRPVDVTPKHFHNQHHYSVLVRSYILPGDIKSLSPFTYHVQQQLPYPFCFI